MAYDFDEIIERRGTGSLKYDCARRRGCDPRLVPLWVADMDFRSPQCVLDALAHRVAHGVFGYTEPDDAFFDALCGWWESRHGWAIDPSWCTMTPGVVYALSCAVQALIQPGDAVLVQQPVYYPFSEAIAGNGRRIVNCPLAYDAAERRYSVDMDAFKETVRRERPALFLLCNPHNPVGRCWTRGELAAMGEVCLENGIVVVSDEIHADFARPGFAHVSFATLGERFAQGCVVCTSASKSFNLAGLQTSTIVIPNARIRRKFRRQNSANGYSQANALGLVATRAAYAEGGAWLDGLREYLEGNLAVLRGRMDGTRLHLVEPESTYLAWVDCRAIGVSDAELTRLVEDEAGLWLDMGDIFGPDGSGFVRINYACPRSVVDDAMSRLVAVLG